MFGKHLQQNKRYEERAKNFNIEFETKFRLEQARLKRKKLEMEMQMKEQEIKHQLLGEKVSYSAKRSERYQKLMMSVHNPTMFKTNQTSTGPQRKEICQIGPVGVS